MKRFSVLILSVLILLLHIPVLAGDAGQETPFSIGTGARALGMGGSFVSLSDDASAIYYNPARLSELNFQELSLMHIDLFEGTLYNFAGWVYPEPGLGGFGIGFFRIGTDDIIRRTNFSDRGTFGYSNSQLLFSYGKEIQEGLSLGASFKVVNQTLDSLSDYGIGIDFGLSSRLTRHLDVGVIFRDILPPEFELDNHTESTPVSIAGGLAFNTIPLGDDYVVNGAFELEKIENRSVKIHSGIELVMSDRYALRTGYDRDNFTFGAGLQTNRFKLDYAYKIMDFIDDSHRFSLSFLIGSSVEDKLLREEKQQMQLDTELLAGERRKQFESYKDKADNYHQQFMLDSALVYYQRALAFDEKNDEIIGVIAGIENSIKVRQQTELQHQRQQYEVNTTIVTFLTQAHNFFDKKYYDAALDMLELIFDINPDYAEAHFLKNRIITTIQTKLENEFQRANKAVSDGNNLEALDAYKEILEIDPFNKKAADALKEIASKINIAQQLNRGIQLFNDGKLRDAKKTFEAVLTLDKKNPVAVEYLKKIELSEAKPTTLEDLQKNKEVWQLYLDGLRYMRNKEYRKAIESWEKVLKDFPNNINTINNIEQARLRLSSEQVE